MSASLVKQLVRYRSLLVAFMNGGVTWVVLIIAPLGLFAVITCTVLVFLSSFVIGSFLDSLWLGLLRDQGLSVAGRTDGEFQPSRTAAISPLEAQPQNPSLQQPRDFER